MTPEQIFGAINDGQTAAVVAAVAETPSLAAARDPGLGSTPLIFAAHRGLDEVVAALLAAGADVHAREEASGTTALHWAAEGGHPGIVRALVASGAEVEARDGWFELTPLGWATVVVWNPSFHQDRPAAAAALLAAGARRDAFSKVLLGELDALDAGELDARLGFVGRGQRPIHLAVARKLRDAVKRLASLGADLGARTTLGMTPLALAIAGGDTSMAALLRQLGAADDASLAVVSGVAPDPAGRDEALLFGAAQIGNVAAVQALLGAGTPPDARLRHLLGEKPAMVAPLHLAAEAGQAAAVQALLDAGADPSAGAADGLPTPLHLAAGGGYLETVRVLLAGGADRTARERGYGATAQGWAEHAGHAAVVAVLAE